MKDKIIQMPERDYRVHPAIARSDLDKIMVSPAHFKRSLGQPSAQTESMRFGTLVHGALLEPETFWNRFWVYGGVRRGAKWDDFQNRAEDARKEIMTASEKRKILAIVDAVKASGVDLSGQVEASVFWQHERTGIDLKARLDLIRDDVVYDLKTTSDLDGFGASIEAYGYHRQAAWYLAAASAAGIKPKGYVLIAVEKKEPWRVEIAEMPTHLIEHGFIENEANLTLYKSCLDSNHWPEYEPEKKEPFMNEETVQTAANVTPISRMDSIRRGKKPGAWKVILYGQPGIGKSTLASFAPAPFFLDLENGLKELDINGTPDPVTSYDEMKDWLRDLMRDKEFQTIVIDTMDVVERWLSARVVETWNRNNKPKVKMVSEIGWGKDGGLIADEWRDFVDILEHINRAGKNVLIVGHQKVEKFKNPMDLDYDYFVYNIHKKAEEYVTGKMDAVLYCRKEQIVKGDAEDTKGKAVTTSRRLVFTDQGASYTAKNRWNMPAEVPMDRGLFDLFK